MFLKIEFVCDVLFSDYIVVVKVESEFLDQSSSFDKGLNDNNLHIIFILLVLYDKIRTLCLIVLLTEVSGRPRSNDSLLYECLLGSVLDWCDVNADDLHHCHQR